jgi:serine/threonine protein kinase
VPEWFDNMGVAILIAGIVLGMRHIHLRNAIHRDLKPGHVLLDDRHFPAINGLAACRGITPPFGSANVGVLCLTLPELIQ